MIDHRSIGALSAFGALALLPSLESEPNDGRTGGWADVFGDDYMQRAVRLGATYELRDGELSDLFMKEGLAGRRRPAREIEPVIMGRPRGKKIYPADPTKKAARKRQAKARATTRKNRK